MKKRMVFVAVILLWLMGAYVAYDYKYNTSVDLESIKALTERFDVHTMTANMMKSQLGIEDVTDIRIEDMGDTYRVYYGVHGFDIKKKDVFDTQMVEQLGELGIYVKKTKDNIPVMLFGDKKIKVVKSKE